MHTPELHRELSKITRAKKRQKRLTLNSYTYPKPSGLTQWQHMQYQVHGDGSIRYTQRYVQPPKNAQPTVQPAACVQPQASAMVMDEFNDYSPGLSWDANNDVQHPKRHRAIGVSP